MAKKKATRGATKTSGKAAKFAQTGRQVLKQNKTQAGRNKAYGPGTSVNTKTGGTG